METSVKKWICVLSNLVASIWTRSICQMQATFPRVEFLRILFRFKKRKLLLRMFTSSIKRQIRRFHVVVVQWTSKKCTKKRDARAELLFWSLNPLFFWSSRCGRRSCLSSLFSLVLSQTLLCFSLARLTTICTTQLVIYYDLYKRGQVPNLSCESEFYLHENKYYFQISGFALSLALKQRLGATH